MLSTCEVLQVIDAHKRGNEIIQLAALIHFQTNTVFSRLTPYFCADFTLSSQNKILTKTSTTKQDQNFSGQKLYKQDRTPGRVV